MYIAPFPQLLQMRFYSSGVRVRGRVFFPSPRLKNLSDLLDRQVALLFPIVKMRRKPNASFGTVIDENLPRQQFAAYLGRHAGNRQKRFRRAPLDFPAY